MKIKSDLSAVGAYYAGIFGKMWNETSVGEEEAKAEYSRSLYICTTEKESLDWLVRTFEVEVYGEIECLVCIVDYFKDSMIRLPYIEEVVDRAIRKAASENGTQAIRVRYFVIEANERDTITRIEDQYNQTQSFRLLSRKTRKKVKQVLNVFRHEKNKMEVKSYANSSLV